MKGAGESVRGANTGGERPQDGSRGPHMASCGAALHTAEPLRLLLQVVSPPRHKCLFKKKKRYFYLFENVMYAADPHW